MQRRIRIFSDSPVLPAGPPLESLKQHFRCDEFEITHLELGAVTTSGVDVEGESVDLFYISGNSQLDITKGRRFAAQTSATEAGVYADGLGPLIMRGGQPVLQRFFADRSPRHDVRIYQSGGDVRRECEPVHRSNVPLPRQIYLGLTQTCNRSCSFCVSRAFDPALLSLDTIREIARKIRGQVEVIALTGAGEAMVHPKFWQILEELSETLPDVQFKMNTSGLALAVDRVPSRLLEHRFRNITISLNAATPETYQRFIGGGFDQVLKGISALVRERAHSASSLELRLTLSMVLMNSTVSELPDFISMAFELGIEEVQGIYLMINEPGLAPESPWHRQEHCNHYFDLASRRAAMLGINLRLPPRFSGPVVSDGFQPSSLPESQGQVCVEPWSTIYIRPNGDVISCPYAERPMGNIFEASLEEIWNGASYTGLRESLVTKNYWGVCRHCCGFNETGRVDDYLSHWLGDRSPSQTLSRSLPVINT